MPPPRFTPLPLTPGRGDSKRKPGGRVDAERSFERRAMATPPTTPSPFSSVSLGRIHRKRPNDGADDGSASNKRRRVVPITPTSSLCRPIVITEDEAPEANSSGSKRRVKSTSSTLLGSPPYQGRTASRYSRPLFPSTPTPGVKRKSEVIDLTLGDDSDDGPITPSSTRLKKTAQPRDSEDVFYSPSVKKPVLSAALVDSSRQQPESKHRQARPVNSAEKKGATMLTRSARIPSFATLFRPTQAADGSPRASKDMAAPMKSMPVQKDNKEILFANGSKFVVHDGESGRDLAASMGASQLKKSSILVVRSQAQKQSELVVDGRAEGSDELQPPTPHSARRKPSMIVVLRVPRAQLRRISLRTAQQPETPTAVCFLVLIPVEIQEMIFEDLLLADDPIQVLHGWAKLYQRQRSNLHPAILSTCRAIYRNASAFLYGRNVFRYMVRDRAQPNGLPSFMPDINVEEYIPFFRRLELKIERSRTERAYCTTLANAIQLLNRHGANLHTLVLDVSPLVEGDTLSAVGYFYQNGEIIQALKALKTCFIILQVLTPKTKDQPATSLRRKLDMRTDLHRFESPPAQPPVTQLDDLSEMITRACESPSRVVEQGLFEEFEVVPLQSERRARPSSITYTDDDDDDDDDDPYEDGDGDDSGDFGS